jgi:acetyl-CoA carboxylase biotin carboxyl carrier protein
VEAKSVEHIQQVVKETRELISILEKTSVSRVSLAAGDFKIEIERAFSTGEAALLPASAPAVAGSAATAAVPRAVETRHVVLAPLVGIFYRSSNPGAKPFVEVGTRVQRGQGLGIIEAMKLMNEVAAEVAGVVVEILVENAQAVQFEQPLFIIDTAA